MIVTTITTSGTKKETTTQATNWGQLKEDLRRNGIQTEGMKAVLKETRATLDINDALIPQQDFKLFLWPGKVKSGNSELVREIERMKGKIVEDAKDTVGQLNVIQEKIMTGDSVEAPHHPGLNPITTKRTPVEPVVVPRPRTKKRRTSAAVDTPRVVAREVPSSSTADDEDMALMQQLMNA